MAGRFWSRKQTSARSLGGLERARKIGALFSRLDGTDPQLSKLIHSSLDMDRLDYLLRDARAAGVPYGEIDLDYLLKSTRISPSGVLGVDAKALAAAEHFLLAHVFMHRVVYYHKTIYGLEEVCRQLLRRVRDSGQYPDDLAADGDGIRLIAGGAKLRGFTDDYVDRIIYKVATDSNDPMIQMLAACLVQRRPPRLLVEIAGVEQKSNNMIPMGASFRQRCRDGLGELIKKHKLLPGQFLLCGPKPIKFEERGSLLTRSDAEKLKSEEKEELIMIFQRGEEEPSSIVDIESSIIRGLSNQVFAIQRLYLVEHNLSPETSNAIYSEVKSWANPPQ